MESAKQSVRFMVDFSRQRFQFSIAFVMCVCMLVLRHLPTQETATQRQVNLTVQSCFSIAARAECKPHVMHGRANQETLTRRFTKNPLIESVNNAAEFLNEKTVKAQTHSIYFAPWKHKELEKESRRITGNCLFNLYIPANLQFCVLKEMAGCYCTQTFFLTNFQSFYNRE